MQIVYDSLLKGNRDYAERKTAENPDYFKNLAQGQEPKVFWIGCADSRVPANQVTGTEAGDIFVHRNVANMVVHTDMNLLSALDYAVNVLQVEHIIVCGHYGCGGVAAAMSSKQFGLIDNWLRHIKDVYRLYKDQLDAIQDHQKRLNKFIELNVVEQVFDLCKTSIIQNAWHNKRSPYIHGWVYNLETGIIKDLEVSINVDEDLHHIYQFQQSQISDGDVD